MDFNGSRFKKEILRWGVRWYVAYPISYRQLEEMMGERGVKGQLATTGEKCPTPAEPFYSLAA